MERLSWKSLIVILAVLGGVAMALPTPAQTRYQSCGWWHGNRIPAQYRVTEQQARKMEETFAKYEKKLAPITDKLASKRLDLDTALLRSDAPASEVTTLRREVRELEDQVGDLQAEANAAAAQVLTPAQRAYFGNAFDLFDQAGGWSCPWDCSWAGRRTSGSLHAIGVQGTWEHGSGWDRCCR